MGYAMKYKKGKGFPFYEGVIHKEEESHFLQKELTPPMEGSLTNEEKKKISNEQDDKELDKKEDEMGL